MMNKKKIALMALVLALCVGIASAVLIPYFGLIQTSVDVNQAILVDDKGYTDMPITEMMTVAGGESFTRYHWLESQTSVAVPISFNTAYYPEGQGITTTYTTTITEGPASEYPDLYHQLVALPIDGMVLSDLLALDLEYTVNVIVNTGTGGTGFAPCINIFISSGSSDKVIENWGAPWSTGDTGLWTLTFADLLSQYGASDRDILGGSWDGTTNYYNNADLITAYGNWDVTMVEVRAQGGASEGQEIRPTQFVVAGRTIDLPDVESFTEITVSPYVILKFAICYEFDLLIQDGAYLIETEIAPVP